MALTARQVETARPKEKDYKLSDERGLYLLVKTTGARYWRLKYRIAGKEAKGKTHSENLCHQYVPCPCYGMASA